MLLYNDSRFINGSIFDYDVLPSEIGYIEEGMALALTTLNGKSYVKRTTGESDQFVGVAFGPRRELVATGYRFIPFLIDPLGVALTYTDIHNAASVASQRAPFVVYTSSTGANTVFTSSGSNAPAAGEYKIVSSTPLTLLFNAADAGKTVNIGFNYTATADDVTFNLGWTGQAYGGQGIDYIGKIPVITTSQHLVTDKFVAAADWFTDTTLPLKVVAGGYFSVGTTISTATDISGAGASTGPSFGRILAAPSVDVPGLTISINM
jgi:hypothetical protein